MNHRFLFGIPLLAIALTAVPHARAGSAAAQGARQDDTVMSSSGGAAWIDCDKQNQRSNPKCAKERERDNRSDMSARGTGKADRSTTVPLAGPEGKGVARGGT